MQNVVQGSLFTAGYLTTSIVQSPEWGDLGDRELAALEAALRSIFERFPAKQSPNESQTDAGASSQMARAGEVKAGTRRTRMENRAKKAAELRRREHALFAAAERETAKDEPDHDPGLAMPAF